MLFSKAVGGAVGPRTSVLSMFSVFNKPVEPKSVAEIVMGQTIWKTTPTMSLIGGGMGLVGGGMGLVGGGIGLGYGFFENSKGDNFGGPVDVSGFGASGATIGAGIGAAMGAPMLIRSAVQGAKFMNTGLKGNTVADAFMNI